MKIRILALIAFLSISFAPVALVGAQDICDDPQAAVTDFCTNRDTSGGNATDNAFVGPNGLLNTVVRMLTFITSVISLFVIVIAGLMYTISAGEPARANKARDAIIYAVVALGVSMFARIIVIYVLNRIG